MVEPNENLYKNSFLDEIQLFSYNEQEEKSNPNEIVKIKQLMKIIIKKFIILMT